MLWLSLERKALAQWNSFCISEKWQGTI